MALEQIFKDVSAEISDMGVAVNCGPAGVHLHLAPSRIERKKLFERSRVRVKETDHLIAAEWSSGVME